MAHSGSNHNVSFITNYSVGGSSNNTIGGGSTATVSGGSVKHSPSKRGLAGIIGRSSPLSVRKSANHDTKEIDSSPSSPKTLGTFTSFFM